VVWARDVAEILPAAAEEGGVFHLTDGEHPAIRQFEAAFAARHRVPPPPALPHGLAWMLSRAADPVSRLTRGRFPLDSRRFQKLTSTLTFSDEQARARLGWKPHAVIPLIGQPGPAEAGETPE
jgi:nucleoside-diphosphate-sugar epimerase